MRMVLLLLLLPFFVSMADASESKPVRFGLTAVVVRENLRFFDDLTRYIGNSLGRPVTFIRRKSYKEIMDLLKSGELEFAWICGYPFVQKRDPEFINLISVPIYRNEPFYRSYIIVPKNSKTQNIADLKGRVFAYSDPDSNSGFLYPRYYLTTSGFTPDNFFRRTVFTYNHAETIEAVATQFADGGAVDSYIWEFMKKTIPEITRRTRVIHASPRFGFPPIVAYRNTPPRLVKKMTATLINMKNTTKGKQLLDALHLDGFGQFSPEIFDDIKVMAAKIRNGPLVPTHAGLEKAIEGK